MKALPLVALIALVAAGCGRAPAPKPDLEPSPVIAVADFVEPPSTTEPTQIALLHANRRIVVGSRPADVVESFRGQAIGGFESSLMPPGFGDPYSALVWQGPDEGIGVISYNDRVVAAMVQYESVAQDRVNEVVDLHRSTLRDVEPDVRSGKRATYWIWDQDGQRLMVSAFQKQRGDVFLTVAMGDGRVLDHLRINAFYAEQDKRLADSIISRHEAQQNQANGESTP
jgi:hypothetical protein